jgi:OmcA/MtrC family decaheme c-type cytochrome
MTNRSVLVRVLLVLLASLLLTASAADRPVKKNKNYNPEVAAGAGYSFVSEGMIAKIFSATIAKDGTITARFTITDAKGRGLDVNGIQTAGTLSVRFVAAYLPAGKNQYVAYTTSTVAATSNKNPSQIQAGTDSGGTFNLIDAATGTYDYVFKTKAPASFDATATHSIGMQAERNLSEFGIAAVQSSDNVYTFVPNGSPVTHVRDVMNEASCNGCHDPISAHGGGRKSMAYCVLCHTPQSVNPDTLNTADMPVFIHKLHMGSSLASVKAGNKYFMVHRGAVTDFSDIEFPQEINNCTACHAAGPKQADNWKTAPSRAACGSCHEEVNFATGLNHANLPQVDDNQCRQCHSSEATADFDLSIPGAHMVASHSKSLPGIVTQIQKVENNAAGQAPIVTFKVTDKAGNPVDISKLTQIRIIMAGSNVDYGVMPNGMARVSEDPSKTQGSNGVYMYNMTNKIPAGATGSFTISIEARNSVTLMPGTMKQTTATDSAMPVQYYFPVDKSKMVPRRQVVATTKCNGCHNDLAFVHGGSRPSAQECGLCHNPTLADSSKASVNFATQIHSIHRGENLANPYVLASRNYQDVRFPGDLRNCNTCHVNNSYQVDNVGAVAAVATPGSLTPTTMPIQAACLGCHDDRPAAVHALVNTSQYGESCVTCHGQNGEFAVDKVHAR